MIFDVAADSIHPSTRHFLPVVAETADSIDHVHSITGHDAHVLQGPGPRIPFRSAPYLDAMHHTHIAVDRFSLCCFSDLVPTTKCAIVVDSIVPSKWHFLLVLHLFLPCLYATNYIQIVID